MRRKIALLLAFSLLVSILPMNVFAWDASDNRAIDNAIPWGGNTGSLFERNIGPAQNLRHWGDGVVVGTPNSVQQLFGSYNIPQTGIIPSIRVQGSSDTYEEIVAAPTGNLRHIVISPMYFMNMNDSSSARNTYNSMLPTGWTFDSSIGTKRLPLLASHVRVDLHNAEMWLNRIRGANNTAPPTGNNYVEWITSWGDKDKDVAPFVGIMPVAETTTEPGTVTLQPGQYDEATLSDGTTFDLEQPRFDGRLTEDRVWLLADSLASTYYAELLNEFGIYVDLVNTTPAGATMRVPPTQPEIDAALKGFFDNIRSSFIVSDAITVINDALSIVTADNNAVSYSAWLGSDSNGTKAVPRGTATVEMSVSLISHSDTRAYLLLARSATMDDEWLGKYGNQSYFSVPIEYMTNSDTNKNSVYLTFLERGGWNQMGENNRQTILSNVTEQRFNITLEDTAKSFHRYGRADIDPIRIAEAAQSAFDRQDWWVEMELVTPGFFWATQSVEDVDVRDISTKYKGINDISPVRLLHGVGQNQEQGFERTPETGGNRYTVLEFPIRLEGQTNINRQVNDWFQIAGLSIAADDRARSGNVEVEVRLYTAASEGNSVGYWQWHPNRETITGFIDPATGESAASGQQVYAGDRPFNAARANRLMPWRNDTTPPVNVGVTANWPDADYAGPREAGGPGDTLRYDSANTQESGNGLTSNGWWQWISTPSGVARYQQVEDENDEIYKDTLVVARYGEIGLELFLHPDDVLPELRTGMQQWDFDSEARIGVGSTYGSVIPRTADDAYHRTARAVLRERVPGSLPATGAHPTSFSFNEGIQILGARLWTNDTAFINEHNDKDDYVWFGENQAESDNFLNASIIGNTLTIRPEIGEVSDDERVRRYEEAEITAEFYISIMAGYESLISEEIELTVKSGTVESTFEEVLPVAYAWDPISLATERIEINDVDLAAYGVIRNIPINDVTVTETRAGSLLPGEQVWIGVEGGISRGWNNADTISIGATTARVVGSSTMEIGPVIMDSHGAYVEIRRASNQDGAQIVFEGVQLSGRVVPEQEYSIIAAGSGIADNWSEFLWLGTGSNTGLSTRGTIHGFFPDEPYPTPAFTFKGEDIYAPPGSGIGPSPSPTPTPSQTPPPPLITQPVTIGEWMNSWDSIREPGTTIQGRPLILQSSRDPAYSISYVKFSVVADLLGVEGDWNESTKSATFSNGHTSVTVTDGSSTATVVGPDGTPRTVEILTAVGSRDYPNGLLADARIIGDYFYVPISFFSDRGPAAAFPINIRWNDGAANSRSITVTPQ